MAQSRISELLAQVGLVPIPCQGQPHPDFHQVAGEQTAEGIAPGEIAVIEEPGFAVLGDRGDLFPLRAAKVLVAPGGKTDEPTGDDGADRSLQVRIRLLKNRLTRQQPKRLSKHLEKHLSKHLKSST